MPNLYSVLQIEQTASQKEIQKSYQKLCLLHHPDKNPNSSYFYEIQKAYEILGNVEKRKDYDQNQHIHNEIGPIQDEIDLDDMEYSEELKSFSSNCRCGGKFVVTEEQLDQDIYGIECSKCSLCVRLFYEKVVD